MTTYSLRKATQEDYEFLRQVHHLALKEHIIKIWPWDEKQQDEFFQKNYKDGNIEVIEFGGKDIGYLQVDSSKGLLHLVNILILPKFQGQGIGAQVVKDLVLKAKGLQQPLMLGVFKVNLRAKRLYESLGFQVYDETDTHFKMKI